jgi:hypothetical protein
MFQMIQLYFGNDIENKTKQQQIKNYLLLLLLLLLNLNKFRKLYEETKVQFV